MVQREPPGQAAVAGQSLRAGQAASPEGNRTPNSPSYDINRRLMKENPVEAQGKSRLIEVNAGTLVGPLWFMGWLFTIAFAQLIWWQALLALLIWPYYLGLAAR